MRSTFLTILPIVHAVNFIQPNGMHLDLAPGPVMPVSDSSLEILSKRDPENAPVRMAKDLVVAGVAMYGGFKGLDKFFGHAAAKSISSLILEASKSFEEYTKTFSRSTVTVTPAATTDSSLVMALGHTTVVNGQTQFIAETMVPKQP